MNWLIFNLLIAHVLGDFYFQSDDSCKKKFLYSFKGKDLWIHAGIIGLLSGIAVWDVHPWAMVIIFIITVTHFLIDWVKSMAQDHWNILQKKGDQMDEGQNSRYDLWVFLADQVLHIGIIIASVYCLAENGWQEFGWVKCLFKHYPLWVKTSIAMLLALKPVNVLVLLILKYFKVNTSVNTSVTNNNGKASENKKDKKEIEDKRDEHGNFHSGKLIGYLERGLILIFVIFSKYEAIGFLIAAKSILRFGEASSGTEKSEYVLAGTFLSLAFALLLGILVIKISL